MTRGCAGERQERGRRVFAAAAAGLWLAAIACAPPAGFVRALPAPPEVATGRIARDVAWLADPAREGRGLGTAGLEAAAGHLAEAFREAGLEPAGDDGSFFQRFDAPVAIEVREARLAFAGAVRERGQGFDVLLPSASGELPADVVFAGHGISDEATGWDDYAGLEVEGRTVLVLDGWPGEQGGPSGGPFDRRRGAVFARPSYKLLNARRHGADAVLLAPAQAVAGLPGVGAGAANPTVRDAGIVALSLARPTAEALVAAAGLDLDALQAALARGRQPASRPLPGVAVAGRVAIERRRGEVANVVARLPGAAPRLASEAVVLGAHFDHLGRGAFGSLAPERRGAVHPGADDNASGTAGLLALARAFAAAPPPRRSLVLVGFTAEEAGLLGSSHYVAHPAVPLERTVAMLNLDMIGRLGDGGVVVFGTGTSESLGPLVRATADDLDLAVTFEGPAMGPSDQTPFAARGVPVLSFFTGVHPAYHTPDDVAAGVDAEGVGRVVTLAYRVARALLDADGRPVFAATPPHGGDRPAPAAAGRGYGPDLGTVPAFGGEPVDGVRLAGVRPGSPAEAAGLRAGDVIVAFDGTAVRSLREFATLLFTRTPGSEVEIVVLRDDERVSTRATLGRRR